MSWPSLASRLNTLPRVLAGPMLRDVTQLSVTVWFALRAPAKVTLRVFAPDDTMILTGQADTCAIGRNLHIVAVTADQLTPPKTGLAENTIYRYKAIFDFKGGESQVPLEAATNGASLAYAPHTLPSFALPPKNLNNLRLLQGSCRRPYAGARDMLPHLNELIAAKADKPLERPHQLLLTGDQIYADDVSDPMRVLVSDAADTLLGWEETLPMPQHFGGMIGARDIHTPMRWAVLKTTGFPSDDLRSHLMSLGEYLSMYLLVWSPVLWPTPNMPTVADVQTEMRRGITETENMLKAARKWQLLGDLPDAVLDASDDEGWIAATLKTLVAFQSKLVDVRRALANVPSYMIFDDHEITDDWNMTRKFCDDIYGSHLGKQMIQNGLVAFALCQHWGNVPALFKTPASGTPPAGARLLAMLDTANPEKPESYVNKDAQYANHATDLRRVLSIHEPAELRASADRAVYHDADALRYDFTVEGTGHQVIFTDTRTWRSFPPAPSTQSPAYSGDPGTHLLRKFDTTDQFKTQIVERPVTGARLLFVVLTTNAPPGQGIRSATRHENLTHTFGGPDEDLYEAWDVPSESFDRLLTALTSKLPVVSGNHTGTIVLLSGDVHHAFASRIGYRATQRYEDTATPRHGAAATIVQLVGSGLKNVAKSTIGLHEEGHFYAPHPGLDKFIRKSLTEAYVGFSFTGAAQTIGFGRVGLHPVPLKVVNQTIDISEGDAPWDRIEPRSVRLSVAPHYRYRIDYIVPSSTTPVVAPPQLKLPGTVDGNIRAMVAFDEAEKRYKRIQPKHIVGVANLCEVVITGSPQPTTITHKVLWWDEYTKGVRTTTYDVPASVSAPNDPKWGDIKAAQEPTP